MRIKLIYKFMKISFHDKMVVKFMKHEIGFICHLAK